MQFEETEQASDLGSDIAETLDLSGIFKTMVNAWKALKEKADNVQKQMDNVVRGMSILRKNPKEMLEVKNT